jgi:DnaJ domain
MNVTFSNAHQVLDVKPGATADELRKAYLNLVRQHPPDRDPDKFRDIHAAYQMLNDPIVLATALLTPSRDMPDLAKVIADAEKIRPRLATLNLLALGNQE